MRKPFSYPALFCAALAFCVGATVASGAELTGIVVGPSSQPVPGAQVAAICPQGVITTQIAGDRGEFDIYVSPLYEYVQLRVSAEGFQTVTVPIAASRIQLIPAPQSESVRTAGSLIDTPGSLQGSSVSVVTSSETRSRNEAQAADLLRETPGLVFMQRGPRGGTESLSIRGGDARDNLVLLDGIPVNGFYAGGFFDFANVAADMIEEIDIARGPQSALYGSDAMAGVVSFVTRSPEAGSAFDVLAEGGTHAENRFAMGGSGIIPGSWLRHWGIAGSLSSLNVNGSVPNSAYRNDSALLSLAHRWRTQGLFAFGSFTSNQSGEPGPWGANPIGLYRGLDLAGSDRNNESAYGLHYRNDLTDSVRLDVFSGFFLDNSGFQRPHQYAALKDIRATADARGTWVAGRHWTMTGGYALAREEMRSGFGLKRNDAGVYWENRVVFGNLFVNAGLREEIFATPGLAVSPARTNTRLNPKIAGAWLLQPGWRLHASYGMGIRLPSGADLAFTNNPALKPERSVSYDAGVEQLLRGGVIALDATWFHNRYNDPIEPLFGLFGPLQMFPSVTIASAGRLSMKGAEFSARLRPLTWLSLRAGYNWLDSALPGRPKQSGSALATLHHGSFDVNVTGYFRSSTTEIEPNIGLAGGVYVNPGYKTFGVNLNYRMKGNITLYANVHNALDAHYEEVYGYPAPLLNVVAGVKWSLARAR